MSDDRHERLRRSLAAEFTKGSGVDGPAVLRGIDAILNQRFMDDQVARYLGAIPGPVTAPENESFLQLLGQCNLKVGGTTVDSRVVAGVLNLLLDVAGRPAAKREPTAPSPAP